MPLAEFSAECRRILRTLPEKFRQAMTTLVVDVLDEPPDGDELLGLFQGIPLTRHSEGDGALPNRILLFRGPHERLCGSRTELRRQLRATILHELAHHFGYEEEDLDDFENRCQAEMERRFRDR